MTDYGRPLPERDSYVHRGAVLDLLDGQALHSGNGGSGKTMKELEGRIATLQNVVPDGHVLLHVLVDTDTLARLAWIAGGLSCSRTDALQFAVRRGVRAARGEVDAQRFLKGLFDVTSDELREMFRAAGHLRPGRPFTVSPEGDDAGESPHPYEQSDPVVPGCDHCGQDRRLHP